MKKKIQIPVLNSLLFLLFLFQNTIANAKFNYDDQDTLVIKVNNPIKKVDVDALQKDALKKEEEAKKTLIKKIGDLFKFTKNARTKEKERITNIVGALGITDSVKLEIALLQNLQDSLWMNFTARSKTDSQQFRDITDLLNSIQTSLKKKDTVIIVEPSAFPPDYKVNPTPLPAPGNMVIPVTQIQTDDINKQSNLSVIRGLLNANGVQVKETDKLKKRAAIHAFYNSGTSYVDTGSLFNIYDVLVYDALLVNASTGSLSGSINKNIIDIAKKANSKVYFTTIIDVSDRSSFLYNTKAQNGFIAACIKLKQDLGADGVNISFRGLLPKMQVFVASFLSSFNQTLKKTKTSFDVCLTLPNFDIQNLYDLKAIDAFIKTYYIDFTKIASQKNATPLAPMVGFGDYNLKTSINFYLKQKIDGSKFVVNLPYSGVKWNLYNNGVTNKDAFAQYVTYKAIRQQYADKRTAYDESISAFIDDSTFKKGLLTVKRIWFDDAITLSQKYTYIIDNRLGGVGISYLGDDGDYGELNSALLYNFYEVDSVKSATNRNNYTFWQKLKMRLTLYNYILINPCEVCFENAAHEKDKENVEADYVYKLGIDSLVVAENKKTAIENLENDSAHHKPLMTAFFYVNNQLNHLMLGMCLLFLALSAVIAYIYIYFLRNVSDKWRYKRPVGWTLVVLLLLFVLTLFGDFFTNDWVPFFGVSSGLPIFNGVDLTQISMPPPNTGECMPDPTCVNMSFYLLTSIILTGAVIGVVIGKYLIFPILKKENVP